MTAQAPTLPVLVWDGDCAFCQSCVQFAQRHIGTMPAVVAYQATDLVALGLTEEACVTAVQYVARDQRAYSANDAVAALLLAAGKGWWVLGALMHVPGVHWLCGVAYRWVARNRHRLRRGPASCAVR